MKFTAAIVAFFVASPGAAQTTNYLEQNVLCGDSKDCETRCRDGRYHIVKSSEGPYFGCAQKADNTRNQGYDNPDCRFGTGDGKSEAAQAQAVCSAAGGKSCQMTFLDGNTFNYCIIIHSEAPKFTEACKAAKGIVGKNNEDTPFKILEDGCK
ncbi:hypothetical protein NQ176_g9008 [Zarea fungicola]|uniref:Uncharacterized protein n=1 Tax=Zarea fungicola TaxID=93591 RepID=A0ACC1MQA8_9HYPO|nr:hypothetical protein NQ176_g9008 [Lecanicillium fungicola]